MTITKYKTSHYGCRIEAVQVEKETEKAVWIKAWTFNGAGTGEPRRHLKSTSYDSYFDSWEAAHTFLMEKAEDAASDARAALRRANDVLGNVKGMKKPEGA
jgi:hypothetical protein